MRLLEIPGLKWLAFSVLATTLLLKMWLAPSDTLGLLLIGSGVVLYVAILFFDYRSNYNSNVFWDEQRGLLAVVRPWYVEVSAARLLASVPLGIDLSHSARKVLQAMNARFENEEGGTLVFFITRPVGNEPTKVGMLVRRETLRLTNTRSKIEQLAKLIMTDIMILESSMRAAYPHLPVTRAESEDLLIVTTGGLEAAAAQ